MYRKIILLILASLFVSSCMVHEPVYEKPEPNPLDPARLSAEDFKVVLVGTWENSWRKPGKIEIEHAVFKRDGTAVVIISADGKSAEVSGPYEVNFKEEPDKINITRAQIIISSSGRTIELNDCTFSIQPALAGNTLLLKLNSEPFGILQRR